MQLSLWNNWKYRFYILQWMGNGYIDSIRIKRPLLFLKMSVRLFNYKAIDCFTQSTRVTGAGLVSWKNFIRAQGCQMLYFQTKNNDLGKFWRALERKVLVCRYVYVFYGHLKYFMSIFGPFGNVVVIWHIFPPFWYIMYVKKNLATLHDLRRS
jgi:hypothetical protein